MLYNERLYTLKKFAIVLKVKQSRIGFFYGWRSLEESKRINNSVQRYLARLVLIRDPTALVAPTVIVKADYWWLDKPLLLASIAVVQNVDPLDIEIVKEWLGGGITSNRQLRVPVMER